MADVIRSAFNGPGRDGDFAWMTLQPEHVRTLFVFNDNEEEFLAHARGGDHACGAGGGNAVLLNALIGAGADVFRISASHDPVDVVRTRVAAVRAACLRNGLPSSVS